MTAAAVSVIIPAYNAAEFLAEAIASVRAQAPPVLEIVVVDDGSTDETPAVMDALRGDDLVGVREQNAGPAAARNRGLELAKGELIAFLDADDVWPPDKLSIQAPLLAEHPEVDVCLGLTQFFGDVEDAPIRFDRPDRSVIGAFLGAGLYRRSAFERIGSFDLSTPPAEDYDWFLRAREAGLRIHTVDAVTLRYRVHPGSLSRGEHADNRHMATVLRLSLQRRRAAGVVRPLDPLEGTFNRDV